MEKMLFRGVVTSIQPRIRVLRSFDRDSPSYLGYALTLLDATSGRTYSIGIGVGSQQKHQFRVGMTISGSCIAVLEPHLESVDYYRASKLKRLSESPEDRTSPPWRIAPPPISVYRSLSPRSSLKRRMKRHAYPASGDAGWRLRLSQRRGLRSRGTAWRPSAMGQLLASSTSRESICWMSSGRDCQ